MRVKFWGTRGSIATPEPEMMHFGGNTSCVEIWTPENYLLIFDAGTGIRRLGLSLLNNPQFEGKGTIFLSHFHWDHIQGFPFFAPAFLPGSHFAFYGQLKLIGRLEASLRGQMEHAYFPVRMEDMQSHLEFHEILEETISVGDALITSRFLHHPQGCLGYRIETSDGVVAYCTDTEHYENRLDPRVLELAQDADILIYDCQYTEEEYVQKKGWGHSTWNEGVKICREAGVKQLIMFHHDPLHDDSFIAQMEKDAQSVFPNTVAATRDMVVEVCRNSPLSVTAPSLPKTRCYIPGSIQMQGQLLIIQAPSSVSEFSSNDYKDQVMEHINKDIQHVAVDLRQVPRLNTAALQTLTTILEVCRAQNAKCYLLHVSPENHDLLQRTHFLDHVPILTPEDLEQLIQT